MKRKKYVWQQCERYQLSEYEIYAYYFLKSFSGRECSFRAEKF
jgi:hypothetical protein